MKKISLIAPCHFGLEAVLKREIYDLGYDVTKTVDGRVTFEGDVEAVALANIGLRTAERLLLEVGSFHAENFEEFFEGIYSLPWENFIPADSKFWVTKVSTVKSKLYAASSLQSVAKKAMVKRLSDKLHVSHFAEEGDPYPVRIFLMKDEVTVGLDTTGAPLHKRGYRALTARAPISETLAAALLALTPWKPGRLLADPFCGSGTFLIEAAMRAANIAPGLNRDFTAEAWTNIIAPRVWKDAREEAKAEIVPLEKGCFFGSDIDGAMIAKARKNAEAAGVAKGIVFSEKDVKDFYVKGSYGFLLTNPPYGERLEDEAALPALYGALGEAYRGLDKWSLYLITSYEDAPAKIGRRPDKNRKIYNGMMRTYFYTFAGPKPDDGGSRGREWKKER